MLAKHVLVPLVLAALPGVSPATVTQQSPWIASEEAQLISPDPEKWDWFGSSVAISGDTALIGSTGKDVGAQRRRGIGLRLRAQRNDLEPAAELIASDGESGDRFGYSIAVSGDTAVVGSFLDDNGAGSAYVSSAAELPGPSKRSSPPATPKPTISSASPWLCRATRSSWGLRRHHRGGVGSGVGLRVRAQWDEPGASSKSSSPGTY